MVPSTHGCEILPHFTLNWNPQGTAVQVQPFEAASCSPVPGLVIQYTHFRPEPFWHDTADHAVCVLGHPILGERIDRPAVVQGYLEAADTVRYAATLNGEFLIIHLDKIRKTLTIINDRFAAIPLYYAHIRGHFMASVYYNDLWNALRSDPSFRLNEEAFFEFMYLQRLLGTKTYDHASAFCPAATVLVFDGQGLGLTKYWTPNFEKATSRPVEYFSEELIRCLRRSIRRKTSDGCRYGLFLSGGMDTRTILAAFDPPPVCFTVGFSENNEVRIAREVARIKGARHQFILVPRDYYLHSVDPLVQLGGGMYVFDHALFFGLRDQIEPHADVVFHGHGMDYFFQGMYLPVTAYKLLSHQTYLKRLRPVQADVAGDFLSTIKYRLKHVDLFRYVRPSDRERLRESLRHAVQEVLDEGLEFCQTAADQWEYLLIHALSRHYSNCNISGLITSAEQRTATFENDIFNLYLSMPPQARFAATAMRGALRTMNPTLAALESANTGLKIDSSPLEQELSHVMRHLKRLVTGKAIYHHPRAEDRTWPYRDAYIRQQPELIEAIRQTSRSPVLADHLPFLDMEAVARDIEAWLNQPWGGADLMATLMTLDRFLQQPSLRCAAFSDSS